MFFQWCQSNHGQTINILGTPFFHYCSRRPLSKYRWNQFYFFIHQFVYFYYVNTLVWFLFDSTALILQSAANKCIKSDVKCSCFNFLPAWAIKCFSHFGLMTFEECLILHLPTVYIVYWNTHLTQRLTRKKRTTTITTYSTLGQSISRILPIVAFYKIVHIVWTVRSNI